jgi:hypothetical protein
LLEPLAISADEPLVFDDDGQVTHGLVQVEQDYIEFIEPGIERGGDGVQVIERHCPGLARQNYIADRVIAEVVDPLVAVQPFDALEQTQRVPVQGNPGVTPVKECLDWVDTGLLIEGFILAVAMTNRLSRPAGQLSPAAFEAYLRLWVVSANQGLFKLPLMFAAFAHVTIIGLIRASGHKSSRMISLKTRLLAHARHQKTTAPACWSQKRG